MLSLQYNIIGKYVFYLKILAFRKESSRCLFCFIQSRWVVELEDRKPKISYFNANGEKKGQLKSQTEVELEKWIDIKIFK